MIDILAELAAIQRTVARTGSSDAETVTVTVARTYPAEPGDVWQAITDPARVRRWFMPLTGDLREGGSFQLEGNAGGDILLCDEPQLLRVTFGSPDSMVEVALEGSGAEQTRLTLTHTVPIALAGSGAGALYVGPGWDGALLALGLYTRGEVPEDPVAAASSPEALAFSQGSIEHWATTVTESETATSEEIAAAVEVSMSQFVPADHDGAH